MRVNLWHTELQKMKSFLSLLLIIFPAFPPVPLSAQDQDEVIRVRSNEVRLDVVVRDKKGRPVKDLNATDFEVLEDGVPRKSNPSGSFRGKQPRMSHKKRMTNHQTL